MPLFKSKETQPVAQAPAPVESTPRSGGLFSKHRHSNSSSEISPVRETRTSTTSSGLGSIFSRNNGVDPSIANARERVAAAENAERQADAALVQARAAVRDAQNHVKQLELEAEEEARLAKIKQGQARDLHNRAKPLGRKCLVLPGWNITDCTTGHGN